MAQHNELGKIGERIAAEYLVRNGYAILETNWRFEKKEIDIIARFNDFVIIAEVKCRSTDFFGAPEEAVTLRKQNLLIEAADYYLQHIDFEAEVRYDIVSIVYKSKDNFTIKHIEEAFIPTID